jgi:fibronectin type 3 domain-containing protein
LAESELSAEVPITPRDTFPPAVPVNIRPSIAPNSIELNWDRNTESDLAGYRVYRAASGGEFTKLAEVSAIPSYSDRSVAHGQTYRYRVTAFDRAGNESAHSAPIEILMP